MSLAGVIVRLDAYVWRNLMPSVGSRNDEMNVLIRLLAADSVPLPSGIDVTAVFVLQDSRVWASVPAQEYASPHPSVLELLARDGPRWSVGSLVDVVVQLDHSSSRGLLLRVDDEIIEGPE